MGSSVKRHHFAGAQIRQHHGHTGMVKQRLVLGLAFHKIFLIGLSTGKPDF